MACLQELTDTTWRVFSAGSIGVDTG